MGLDLVDYAVLGCFCCLVTASVRDATNDVNKSVQELNETMKEAMETNIAQRVNSEFEKRIKIGDVNQDGTPDLYIEIGDKKFVAYGSK